MKQGKHGGDIYSTSAMLNVSPFEILDYSSNVGSVQPQVLEKLDTPLLLSRLPEPHSSSLRKAYAEKEGLKPENVCVTSGTTEAIEKICRVFSGKRADIYKPTYSDYENYCNMYGLSTKAHSATTPADICFICNPNNPTGKTISREAMLEIIHKNEKTFFVVDESYMPFHVREKELTLKNCGLKNVAVLRSFSKIFSVPGLRLGFLVSADSGFIKSVTDLVSSWSVSTIAQEAGMLLLNEDTHQTALKTEKLRNNLLHSLARFKWIEPLESDVNFVLCRLKGVTSADVFEKCLKQKVLIRDCSNFEGLDGEYIRFSIKDDMKPLINALEHVI